MVQILLVVFSVIGFLISTYFTSLSYRWIRPDARWIPLFCQMNKQTCSSIVFTPRARVFGVPNSVLGQIFYAAILSAIFAQVLFLDRFYYPFLLASMITVVLGAYLTYSLLFLTRIPCKLCFTSHAINLVIFIFLVY